MPLVGSYGPVKAGQADSPMETWEWELLYPYRVLELVCKERAASLFDAPPFLLARRHHGSTSCNSKLSLSDDKGRASLSKFSTNWLLFAHGPSHSARYSPKQPSLHLPSPCLLCSRMSFGNAYISLTFAYLARGLCFSHLDNIVNDGAPRKSALAI